MKRTPLHRYTPLRRGPWRRTPRPRRPPQRGYRSRSYLDFVRAQGCLICGATAQAAHTGPHGLALRASDYSAIPLCAEHHLWEFQYSYHRLGRDVFQVLYGVNIQKCIERLHAEYGVI
jgi:hypothetical protein